MIQYPNFTPAPNATFETPMIIMDANDLIGLLRVLNDHDADTNVAMAEIMVAISKNDEVTPEMHHNLMEKMQRAIALHMYCTNFQNMLKECAYNAPATN